MLIILLILLVINVLLLLISVNRTSIPSDLKSNLPVKQAGIGVSFNIKPHTVIKLNTINGRKINEDLIQATTTKDIQVFAKTVHKESKSYEVVFNSEE